MEIKRRLTKIQKRMTPFIEQMNIGVEMNRLCKRFEELLDYGEAKEAKHIKREKTGMSQSMRIDADRKRRSQEIADIHQAEAEEMMRDQEQHKAQPESAKEDPFYGVGEDDEVKFDPSADAPESVQNGTADEPQPKKKKKKKKKA